MSTLAIDDTLTAQRDSIATIRRLVSSAPADALTRRPAPGKWSIVEILAHLADDELTSSWRYRQMIEHDGVPLAGFDQELWARLGDYASWSASDAFETFRLLREANLRMLSHLSPAEWERSGEHVERGRITVRSLAAHMAGHDANHIRQIERILAGSV
jgi:uncharacterized damage-inducible protein DinB